MSSNIIFTYQYSKNTLNSYDRSYFQFKSFFSVPHPNDNDNDNGYKKSDNHKKIYLTNFWSKMLDFLISRYSLRCFIPRTILCIFLTLSDINCARFASSFSKTPALIIRVSISSDNDISMGYLK